jgi:hypothetical protein
MKQVIFSLLLLLTISLGACSQKKYSYYDGKKWEQLEGNGRIVKMYPPVEAFKTVLLENLNVTVKVKTGSEQYALAVEIDDNLKEYFKWRLEKGVLKIWLDWNDGKSNKWLSSSNISVSINAPALESLISKSNCNLEMDIPNQPSFSLVTYGNPDIRMSGKLSDFVLQTYGNAAINASSLLTEKITLSADGNADIEVNAKELLEKSVNGNNDIRNVYGKSGIVKQETSIEKIELVSFKLKNNSLLPAKVTLISYRPDVKGNGTAGFVLMSLCSKNLSFPAGTKLYLANSEQVNTVMGGNSIESQVPFLEVKQEDAGKVFVIK